MTKRLKNYFVMALFLIVGLTFFSACSSSSTRINYDLTASDTYATSMVQNIQNDPYKYSGKTLKVWGKFKGSSSYYTLNENASCCRWSFEVKLDGVTAPDSGDNVTVVGKCIVEKTNGTTSWYLKVNEID